jgi:hypothetical protein
LICAALLAFFLLSTAGAFAGDYSLTYAIDANGKNDAGKKEACEYARPCEIKPVVGFGLSILISFSLVLRIIAAAVSTSAVRDVENPGWGEMAVPARSPPLALRRREKDGLTMFLLCSKLAPTLVVPR